MGGTNENFVLVVVRRCKADGTYELVESSAELLVEAVERRMFLSRQGGIAGNRIEQSGGERLRTAHLIR